MLSISSPKIANSISRNSQLALARQPCSNALQDSKRSQLSYSTIKMNYASSRVVIM